MRKVWIGLLLALCLLWPLYACAEISLNLSAECVAAESVLDFTIEGDSAPLYRYTMLKDGKQLFQSEVQLNFGSYLPRKAGAYTLQVTAVRGEEEETAEAEFTVTEKMTCTLSLVSDEIRAGEPLKVSIEASGGTGEYQYHYTVLSGEKTVCSQLGEENWHWTPAEEGAYTLRATVLDTQGGKAQEEAAFSVEAGPGISLEVSGGDLGSQGGQKSWTVYSAYPWTAQTDASFMTLETAGGLSGDSLTVTVDSETNEYREGKILITSGKNTMEWTAAQSAGHGVDEEITLFAEPETLLVDGKEHIAWLSAQGSRTFAITASDAWTASSQDDFIQLKQEGETLTLLAAGNTESAVRSGMVTLACGNSYAYIHVYQLPAQGSVSHEAPPAVEESGFVPYSQFSGLWKEKRYGVSTLEHSGCAIFALSHALELLGYEGETIQPEALAKKYAFCLRDGGTINSTLIGNAGDDLGFKTRYELYDSLPTIRSRMDEGAVYSFAVVSGHIAMIAEKNEDGTMFRIIDSAPSATWERIQNAQLYRQEPDGSFAPISSLEELEGIRYYIENQAFGGTTYWLTDEYVARRGVRLIQPKE